MIPSASIDALTLPQKIALAMAILERGGFCQDVAGQIVVRDPDDANRYYTNPWGATWCDVRASDILVVDDQSRRVAGNDALAPSPSLELHFGILRRRPDVAATIHNHPPLATAWSATRKPVLAYDQTSAIFFERQAWCEEFVDVETLYDPALFGRTGEDLGPVAHLLWMRHHGVMLAHKSVEFLTVYALYVERTVRLNLDVAAIGGAEPLPDDVARKMRDLLQTVFVIPDTWRALVRQTLAERPEILR